MAPLQPGEVHSTLGELSLPAVLQAISPTNHDKSDECQKKHPQRGPPSPHKRWHHQKLAIKATVTWQPRVGSTAARKDPEPGELLIGAGSEAGFLRRSSHCGKLPHGAGELHVSINLVPHFSNIGNVE